MNQGMKNLVSKFETKSSETQNLTKSSKKIRDGDNREVFERELP